MGFGFSISKLKTNLYRMLEEKKKEEKYAAAAGVAVYLGQDFFLPCISFFCCVLIQVEY